MISHILVTVSAVKDVGIEGALTSTVANLFSFVASFAASLFSSGNFMPHSVMSRPGETELTRIDGEQMTARALLK